MNIQILSEDWTISDWDTKDADMFISWLLADTATESEVNACRGRLMEAGTYADPYGDKLIHFLNNLNENARCFLRARVKEEV